MTFCFAAMTAEWTDIVIRTVYDLYVLTVAPP
jgi:hypothetical protein